MSRATMTAGTRGLCLALLLAASLQGCGAPPPPPPPAVMSLEIDAGKDQNPEPDGTPAPVAVHVYQLTATGKFERADVFALIDREKATLGPEGLASEEVVVTPGEQRTLKRELMKGVQFIGVTVLFRDIDHATWRVMTQVPDNGPIPLTLDISKLKATLTQAKAGDAKKPDAKLPKLPPASPPAGAPALPSLPSAPSLPSMPSMPAPPKV
jgi:type VI secretion system protein VasD